ncbi:TPA: PRTRC system ThiF family protein [Vibrio parahaemolyticus]|uniref:PRTRC system ThiF family protein n=1 Tax=Vibrio campbellii TaxID=680 RepID=UPI001F073D0D|nr:PRTRC system ThiF family protein [Vibrio campbellii]UMM06712.1 PRTRC system ThiF family protein [Vibrio campbellii]
MNNFDLTDTARSFYIPHKWTEQRIKVALVGLGGTGSAMLTELFQMGGILKNLGYAGLDVVAYDGDTVSQSNVFRQNFWEHDIGKNKAEVLINRFNQFGGINWKAVPEFFTSQSVINGDFDLLITAVDKASVRIEIGQALERSSKQGLWLDMGNDNHQANVLLGSLNKNGSGSPLRLPSPFELFGSQWAESAKTEVDTASCSTAEAIKKQTFGINGMTARSAASMLLFPLIRSGELRHHGLFIDLHQADISKMPVDPLQWSIYGYQEEETPKH